MLRVRAVFGRCVHQGWYGVEMSVLGGTANAKQDHKRAQLVGPGPSGGVGPPTAQCIRSLPGSVGVLLGGRAMGTGRKDVGMQGGL